MSKYWKYLVREVSCGMESGPFFEQQNERGIIVPFFDDGRAFITKFSDGTYRVLDSNGTVIDVQDTHLNATFSAEKHRAKTIFGGAKNEESSNVTSKIIRRVAI